jgi:hypothetical protein
MNASRKVMLATAISAKDVWDRVALVLPTLLRVHVQARVDDHDVAGTTLPVLLGPTGDDSQRTYKCTERATTASADLIHNVIGDREATFVSATILSHSVSHGLYVLQLWTDSEPSDVLFLKSHDHVIEQQVAAIRSAFDVRDVQDVFLR